MTVPSTEGVKNRPTTESKGVGRDRRLTSIMSGVNQQIEDGKGKEDDRNVDALEWAMMVQNICQDNSPSKDDSIPMNPVLEKECAIALRQGVETAVQHIERFTDVYHHCLQW